MVAAIPQHLLRPSFEIEVRLVVNSKYSSLHLSLLEYWSKHLRQVKYYILSPSLEKQRETLRPLKFGLASNTYSDAFAVIDEQSVV